ncbi:MAG TPA: hypothetical protein VMQ45_15575 [Burkholderiaceae bacterium]|nr:hypothetical protein [Burkholderiaceae bacterium]
MKQSQFYPGKNDFFFACLITAMFAVTLFGVIAGTLDLIRGHAGAVYAATPMAPIALAGAGEQAPHEARAGPRR